MTTPRRPPPSIAGADAARARPRRRRASEPLRAAGFYLFVGLFILFCVLPFAWSAITSFKSEQEITLSPPTYLPGDVDLVHWRKILTLRRFTQSLVNSTIVASGATLISLTIGSICAYALARLRFPGKNLVLAAILAVAMFPGITIVSPLFLQFRSWNLINSYWSLILPSVTFTLPICVWTLNAFFRDLPMELEEAARVDGATRAQTFTRIIAPLAAPGVFTTAILLFIAAWNEYLFARTFMLDQAKYTAPVAIAQFQPVDVTASTPWGQITAAAVVITLPLVILVLVFQRRIVAGLTAGAVKG